MKLAFVLPTKNEQETIGQIIVDIKSFCEKNGFSSPVVIITDDSRDNTRKIAKNLGAIVVVGGGKGLGHAMYKGLKKSLDYDVDLVFSLDADGQVDLDEIQTFLTAQSKEDADLVLGSRFQEKNLVDYNYKFVNRTGIKILVRIINSITNLGVTDSHGGIRVMRPEIIDALEIIGTHTYVQETIIDAHENGFKIIEIASKWLEREAGHSRVVFSIPKYVFYTLPVLALRAGAHIKYLYPVGIILIFLAFLDIVSVFIMTGFSLSEVFDRQSFNLFLLLFMTGLNLFFFGFMFELLANIRRRAFH